MSAATVEKLPNQMAVFRHELGAMEDQFQKALPAHIPPERFARVVMTAIQNNPKLLDCTRQSLWNACMKAAQDGLLPDGREGAIVSYGENEGGQKRADIANWMPMIGGIRKKARNSGDLSGWEAHCVYENDQFSFELGDEPFIRHAPALGDRGKIIAAYSIATLKDGYKSREVMSIKEIEGVRSKSKAKKGPWNDPIFYPEMCKKVVARRHAKVLPMATDLDDLIRRDDSLYDLDGAREDAQATRPRSIAGKLDALAQMPERTIDHSEAQDASRELAIAEGDEASAEPQPSEASAEPGQDVVAPPQGDEPKSAIDESVEWRSEMLAFFADARSMKAIDVMEKTRVLPNDPTKKKGIFPGDYSDVTRAIEKARRRVGKTE